MKSSLLINLQKNKYLLMIPSSFKKDKAQKYTTLGLTLFTLIFFALFAINPTLSTIAKLRKQLADEKFVDQQLQTKINNLSSLQKQYTQIQPDIKYVNAAIPQKPDYLTLSAQIQQAAQEAGVSLVNLEISQTAASPLPGEDVVVAPPPTINQASSFSVAIVGTGSYNNISSFIDTLSNMQRVLTFDTISINKSTGEQNALTTTIKAAAYFKE